MARKECLKRLKSFREVWIFLYFCDEYSIESFCFKRSCMIFCIASSSSRLYITGLDRLEMLVVDEAAQLKECESHIPLQLSGLCHFVLIENGKQLPALVESDISVKAGLRRSLFDMLALLGLLQKTDMRKHAFCLYADSLGKGYIGGLDYTLDDAKASKFMPTVFLHLRRKSVLNMEWMVGESTEDLLSLYTETCLLLETCLFHFDGLHPGNFCYSSSGLIGTTKFICKIVNVAYYCYCVQPPQLNVSNGPYLCTKHTKNALSMGSFMEYTSYDECGRLIVKENYCSVCWKVHVNFKLKPMVFCDNCQLLLHCHSGNISEEKYRHFQVGVILQFMCPTGGECSQVKNGDDDLNEFWRRMNIANSIANKHLIVSFGAVVSSIGVVRGASLQTVTILQNIIIIKDCFMGLGLIPQDRKKLTIASLIDKCTKLNKLDDGYVFHIKGSLYFKQWDSGGCSLVHWEGPLDWEATWKHVTITQLHCPNFNLEDKVDFYGEGNVMIPARSASKGNRKAIEGDTWKELCEVRCVICDVNSDALSLSESSL